MLSRKHILWVVIFFILYFHHHIHSALNFLFYKFSSIFLFLSIHISEFSTGKFCYHFLASCHDSCPVHPALSYQCTLHLKQSSGHATLSSFWCLHTRIVGVLWFRSNWPLLLYPLIIPYVNFMLQLSIFQMHSMGFINISK